MQMETRETANGPQNVAEIFEMLEKIKAWGIKLEKRKTETITDIILQIVCDWEEKIKTLKNSRDFSSVNFYDSERRLYFSVPWMIAVMRKKYNIKLSVLLGAPVDELTDKEVAHSVSSLFSQLRKTFETLDLLEVSRKKLKSEKAFLYIFKKNVYELSFEEIWFLVENERKVQERKRESAKKI